MAIEDSPFLSRWSRRKALAREGQVLPEPTPEPPPVQAAVTALAVAPPAPIAPIAPISPVAAVAQPTAPAPAPALTLDDVALLTRESDYAGFVARGVTPEVRNAALKKLFTDPHFNVMDGLDTYIDDYSLADPLPEGMLRQMVQSKMLGLFDDEDDADSATRDPIDDTALPPPATPTLAAEPPDMPLPPPNPTHEDADLQLQPDDAARRPGAAPGAGQDPGRQH